MESLAYFNFAARIIKFYSDDFKDIRGYFDEIMNESLGLKGVGASHNIDFPSGFNNSTKVLEILRLKAKPCEEEDLYILRALLLSEECEILYLESNVVIETRLMYERDFTIHNYLSSKFRVLNFYKMGDFLKNEELIEFQDKLHEKGFLDVVNIH